MRKIASTKMAASSSTEPERESSGEICATSDLTGGSGESESCPSLLDTLRSPRPSDLARKRKIHFNPPAGKKRSQAGNSAGKHNPKTVTPSQRALKFPGEQLTASGGKLFCKAGSA